ALPADGALYEKGTHKIFRIYECGTPDYLFRFSGMETIHRNASMRHRSRSIQRNRNKSSARNVAEQSGTCQTDGGKWPKSCAKRAELASGRTKAARLV